VVFAFMSLLHGPVMAFAMLDTGAAHHAVSSGGPSGSHLHHQKSEPEEPAASSMPDAVAACYGVGCFIALDVAVGALPANVLSIGTVSPGKAGALVPAYLEPAIPPPRL
jgi:hypothetical protein